jgi:hypothetical protein
VKSIEIAVAMMRICGVSKERLRNKAFDLPQLNRKFQGHSAGKYVIQLLRMSPRMCHSRFLRDLHCFLSLWSTDFIIEHLAYLRCLTSWWGKARNGNPRNVEAFKELPHQHAVETGIV